MKTEEKIEFVTKLLRLGMQLHLPFVATVDVSGNKYFVQDHRLKQERFIERAEDAAALFIASVENHESLMDKWAEPKEEVDSGS